MSRLTVRLSTENYSYVEKKSSDGGEYGSKAEVVDTAVTMLRESGDKPHQVGDNGGDNSETDVDGLNERIQELETKCQDLKKENIRLEARLEERERRVEDLRDVSSQVGERLGSAVESVLSAGDSGDGESGDEPVTFVPENQAENGDVDDGAESDRGGWLTRIFG